MAVAATDRKSWMAPWRYVALGAFTLAASSTAPRSLARCPNSSIDLMPRLKKGTRSEPARLISQTAPQSRVS